MNLSRFVINKMDCPTEEQLVRLKLDDIKGIKKLEFDLDNRILDIYHQGSIMQIEKAIDELKLESRLIKSEAYKGEISTTEYKIARSSLKLVLAINLFFFFLEFISGLLANSLGLIADSFDMLADVIVYGLSLYALNKAITRKRSIAKVSGFFQFILAIFGLFEVLRRFLGFDNEVEPLPMITISFLALIGNAISLIILRRSKSNEINIRASQIFTSTDVIVNIGVIIAGVLVYITRSNIPDLLIGSLVFLLVARGAVTILKLAK